MRLIALGLSLAMLAACSGGTALRNPQAGGDGPDEFAIVPTRSLQMPPDLAQLPAPTPGGGNITDPTPVADAVAVLGGVISPGAACGAGSRRSP